MEKWANASLRYHLIILQTEKAIKRQTFTTKFRAKSANKNDWQLDIVNKETLSRLNERHLEYELNRLPKNAIPKRIINSY